MNNEITFSTLWLVFKKSWIKIIIISLAAMLLMGLFTHYVIKKEYSSSITFYVINANTSADYTQSSLLAASAQLSNDYIRIIQSDEMLDALTADIKEEYGLEYTPNGIRKMISSNVEPESSMFEVKITSENKEHAYIIAKYISENAPEVLQRVTKPWMFEGNTAEELAAQEKDTVECVSIINYPHVALGHDSPSLAKNVILAGFVAAILTYGVCFLFGLFNTLVKNEDDIKEFTEKYPLIGIIPSWYTE